MEELAPRHVYEPETGIVPILQAQRRVGTVNENVRLHALTETELVAHSVREVVTACHVRRHVHGSDDIRGVEALDELAG